MARLNSYERGYGRRWGKARLTYLKRNPLCVMCKAQGKVAAATVCDHIVPHKGNQKLFWDSSNWQALCEVHHNNTKQRVEVSGREIGYDVNGMPLDREHAWHR